MMQTAIDFFTIPFLRNALLAVLLASVAAGLTGSIVVVRRSTYLAGAVAHSVLAGIGLSVLISSRWHVQCVSPMTASFIAAAIVACLVSFIRDRGFLRRDTVLSAIWTGSMAAGIIFIFCSPGYQQDLTGYLFGSVLLITSEDLLSMCVLDIAVVVCTILFYNRFLAIAFNAESAKIRGLKVGFYEFVYNMLTALTVVLLVRVVGIVLAVALLTLPAATAGFFANRLNRMMVCAIAISALVSVAGLAVSYPADLPPGAIIVLISVLLYVLAALFRSFRFRRGYVCK